MHFWLTSLYIFAVDYESRYAACINLTISYKIPEIFIQSQVVGGPILNVQKGLHSFLTICLMF